MLGELQQCYVLKSTLRELTRGMSSDRRKTQWDVLRSTFLVERQVTERPHIGALCSILTPILHAARVVGVAVQLRRGGAHEQHQEHNGP